MKQFKTGLHWLIGVSSLISFLAGWVVLAHSPKPAQPLEPLAPLPPIQDSTLNASASQNKNDFSLLQFFAPRTQRFSSNRQFVTRGS